MLDSLIAIKASISWGAKVLRTSTILSRALFLLSEPSFPLNLFLIAFHPEKNLSSVTGVIFTPNFPPFLAAKP